MVVAFDRLHGAQRDSAVGVAQVRAKPLPRTSPMRSQRRADARALAASILASVLDARGWSNGMGARCLGVDESLIRMLRTGERAFEVGDLLLLGSVGVDVIVELQRRLDAGARQAQARTFAAARLVQATGKLLADTGEAQADGVIDDEEIKRIERDGCAVVDALRAIGETRR